MYVNSCIDVTAATKEPELGLGNKISIEREMSFLSLVSLVLYSFADLRVFVYV